MSPELLQLPRPDPTHRFNPADPLQYLRNADSLGTFPSTNWESVDPVYLPRTRGQAFLVMGAERTSVQCALSQSMARLHGVLSDT